MKTPRLFASMLCVIAIVVLESGCTSASSSPVPVRQLHTYSIVAIDDQGVLSATELNQIEDTLVQYLIDQKYVRADQTLLDDPAAADTVFRIRLAWNEGRSSFAIVEVAPSYSGGYASSGPPPAYASAAPWPDDDWSYDPWLYDDNFGYAYCPYCPFMAFFPFFPYYGFEHHHRPPVLIVHRPPPDHRPPLSNRPPPWIRYGHYMSSRYAGDGFRPPLLAPRRPGAPSRHERPSPPAVAAWRGSHPSSGDHTLPADRSNAGPGIRNPEHRAPPIEPRRPSQQYSRNNDQVRRQDALPGRSPNPGSDSRQSSDTHQRPTRPGSNDRLASTQAAMPQNQRGAGADHRPPPDLSSRRQDTQVRPSPAAMPPREYSQTQRNSSPPAAMPAREPASSPRFSPPPQRDYSPPASSASSSPSHAEASSPPAQTSSRSDNDSKSHGRDR